jgi:putative transposase
LVKTHGLSVARACAALKISRAAWYQPSRRGDKQDQEVIEALIQTVEKHPRWGFWKCYDDLRLNGCSWNHKRVWRVYRKLKLNLPRRVKRRIQRERVPLEITAAVNHSWSLHFMQDVLYSGKRFRTLNVIDEGVRECLAIEVDTSLKAERVVRVLERLKAWRGTSQMIRLDNGPELTSVKLQVWCESNGVELKFIQPGKPNQNAFIERFNRTFRSEVLNAYIFESLEEVREAAWWWMIVYNEERPHEALGGLPPSLFRERPIAKTSTFELST